MMPRSLTLAIRHGFYAGCYAVLVGLVVLPFFLGMEPGEFWAW